MKLNELTITQAREGLLKGDFSSLDLTRACLERIKKLNGRLNAFLTVCEKEALEKAKEADAWLLKDKRNTPPLCGIPYSLKDAYSTAGIRTTAGSKVLENYHPVYNATVYQKLLDQKAVLLGKTNMDAWGHGSSTENSDFGVTRNPWHEDYVPGGSSGGCGAAVSSQMAFFSIGEDTGGSIRLPASFCSIVGLKVTYGLVSRYGLLSYASSLDSVGPFARTVEDCALILAAMAGGDERDATSARAEAKNYPGLAKGGLKGIKIGLPKEFFDQGVEPGVKKAVLAAGQAMKKLGACLVEVGLPMTKYANAVYYIIAPSETSSNLARYDGLRFGEKREMFGEEAKRRIMLGTYALSAGYFDAFYLKAMKVRTLIKDDFQKAFKTVDVLLAPVSPTPPFKIGDKIEDPLTMYLSDVLNISANLAGIPSLAIPCGFSDEGLPIGLQIMGRQFDEGRLLRVGQTFEEASGFGKEKPVL